MTHQRFHQSYRPAAVADDPSVRKDRHPLEQILEGLDWFVGAPLIALGCLGLIAELVRPSREGLVVFLSLAALLVGTPLLLAAVAVRGRWSVRWFLQAFALVWLPVFYLVYLG